MATLKTHNTMIRSCSKHIRIANNSLRLDVATAGSAFQRKKSKVSTDNRPGNECDTRWITKNAVSA